jgi:large subunit ribosomal protein L35Ae
MKGVIANFRRGRHRQVNNQMIIIVDSVDSKEKAAKLVGKHVVWTSPAKKEIMGEIRSIHGGKGAIRVLFEKGMPGQSVGTKVEVKA